MIDTIIFDMGMVLVDFRWKKLFAEMGLSGERFDRLARATVLDPVWNEFDRGVWTEDEMCEAFIKNDPGMEKEIRQLMNETFPGILRKFPYTDEWIDSLKKKGYRLMILSNFSEKALRECADELGYIEKVDDPVISCKIKMIKPDPEIFQYVLDNYGIVPENTVFIDDNEDNINAAKAFGLNTVLFTDKASADVKLAELGV